MKKVTLTNSFHNTEITVQAKTAKLFTIDRPEYPTRAEKAAMRRVRKSLCGANDCTCGVVR